MPTFSSSVPQFQLTFDILNGTLTFTDTVASGYSSYGTIGNFVGIVKITHTTTGTLVYSNGGWLTNSFVSPDIKGAITADWVLSAMTLPTSPNGIYTVEYKASIDSGTNYVLVTRTYTLDYTAPVVKIDMNVLCSTSELESEDVTDYDVVIGGVAYTPTITRAHDITAPAGSGFTPVASATAAYRKIGGGSTSAERIWTRTWQTNIVSALSYTLSAWSTTAPAVVLTDTVYGDDNIFAQCDATICALATCYSNLLTRWIASINSNFDYRDNNRDKVLQATALWDKLILYERCGTSIESTILELKTLLAGEDCNCTIADDTVSTVIVPWAALTGGGTSASTFAFTITSATPSGGNPGDVHLNSSTWILYQNVAGSWPAIGSILGATGSAGSDGSDATSQYELLVSNTSTEHTAAGTSKTALSTYSFDNSIFQELYSKLKMTVDIELAANPNGKTIEVELDGTSLASVFYDDLVTSANKKVVVIVEMVYLSNTTQTCKVWIERCSTPGETVGPLFTSTTATLTSSVDLIVYGTNSVASANDITCTYETVEVFHAPALT